MDPNLSASIITPMEKFKMVFLGDQAVGKTSIINRFIFDTFEAHEHPTVGIDFISKNLTIGDRVIRLQLWDTAGQERFRSLIPNYIRDCSVALVVYDSTSQLFKQVNKVLIVFKNGFKILKTKEVRTFLFFWPLTKKIYQIKDKLILKLEKDILKRIEWNFLKFQLNQEKEFRTYLIKQLQNQLLQWEVPLKNNKKVGYMKSQYQVG